MFNSTNPHAHKKKSKARGPSKVTLNVKHDDFISKFAHQRKKIIPAKQKRINMLEKNIQKLETRKTTGEKLTATEHSQLFKMQKELKFIQHELLELTQRTQENTYFLKNKPHINRIRQNTNPQHQKTQNIKWKKITTQNCINTFIHEQQRQYKQHDIHSTTKKPQQRKNNIILSNIEKYCKQSTTSRYLYATN